MHANLSWQSHQQLHSVDTCLKKFNTCWQEPCVNSWKLLAPWKRIGNTVWSCMAFLRCASCLGVIWSISELFTSPMWSTNGSYSSNFHSRSILSWMSVWTSAKNSSHNLKKHFSFHETLSYYKYIYIYNLHLHCIDIYILYIYSLFWYSPSHLNHRWHVWLITFHLFSVTWL